MRGAVLADRLANNREQQMPTLFLHCFGNRKNGSLLMSTSCADCVVLEGRLVKENVCAYLFPGSCVAVHIIYYKNVYFNTYYTMNV